MGGKRVQPLTQSLIIYELMKDRRRFGIGLGAQTLVQEAHDAFTVTATPSSTYTLSTLPLAVIVVAVNGEKLVHGTEWSCDNTTGIVTLDSSVVARLKATPTPADVVSVDYLVTAGLVAQSAADAPVFVQGGVGGSLTAASRSVSLASPSTVGDLLVAVVGADRTSGGVTGITGGGTWTRAVKTAYGTGTSNTPLNVEIWLCKTTTSTSSVAFTFSASGQTAVQVHEFSGPTGTVVASNNNQGGSGGTADTGAATLSGASLAIVGTSVFSSNYTTSPTDTPSAFIDPLAPTFTGAVDIRVGYLIASSGTAERTVGVAGVLGWGAAVVTLS